MITIYSPAYERDYSKDKSGKWVILGLLAIYILGFALIG